VLSLERKVVITDEGKFDPESIPKKKWEEYQAELWEAQTSRDDRSEISGISYGTKYQPAPMSEYNLPPSRPMSQMGGGNNLYESKNPNMYNSHMSLAQPEMLMPGNRQSQFGGSQYLGQQELEMSNLAGLPSDDAILAEIREILKTADLMTVTKKSIKVELERRFGVPLDSRRAYINSGIFLCAPWM
jgi:chitin synthase